jgi:hypothetical protein
MTVTKEDMDWFLTAMKQVLADTTKTGATLKTIGRLAAGAVRG